MKRVIVVCVLFSICMLTFADIAKRPFRDYTEQEWMAQIDDPPVLFWLAEDETIERVCVMGTASLSTTMRAFDAKRFARTKAEIDAKTKLAIWIKECVVIKEKHQSKYLTVTEGHTGQAKPTENSEVRQLSDQQAERFSESFWRGMSPAGSVIDAEKGYVGYLWVWTREDQKNAKILEEQMKDGTGKSGSRSDPDMTIQSKPWKMND